MLSREIATNELTVGCLELSIKKTAHPVTQMLHDDVKIGDKVTVAGPGGSFYYLKDDANAYEHVVLIGGGIGGMFININLILYFKKRIQS